MSAILERCFAFATEKYDEINLVCKVTCFKKVLLLAEWTVNFIHARLSKIKQADSLREETIKAHVMRLPSTHGIKRSVLVKKRSSNSIQENSEPIQTRWKKDNVEKSSNKINLSNAISQRWPQTFLDYIKTRLSIVCSGRKIEENNCYFCQY